MLIADCITVHWGGGLGEHPGLRPGEQPSRNGREPSECVLEGGSQSPRKGLSLEPATLLKPLRVCTEMSEP